MIPRTDQLEQWRYAESFFGAETLWDHSHRSLFPTATTDDPWIRNLGVLNMASPLSHKKARQEEIIGFLKESITEEDGWPVEDLVDEVQRLERELEEMK